MTCGMWNTLYIEEEHLWTGCICCKGCMLGQVMAFVRISHSAHQINQTKCKIRFFGMAYGWSSGLSQTPFSGLAKICDTRLFNEANNANTKLDMLKAPSDKTARASALDIQFQGSDEVRDAQIRKDMDAIDWMILAHDCYLHTFGGLCLQFLIVNHNLVRTSFS